MIRGFLRAIGALPAVFLSHADLVLENLALREGMSFVKLLPPQHVGDYLTQLDWFMPCLASDWDQPDLDVGSSGPLLVPATDALIGGGKQKYLYVLRTGVMGGNHPDCSQELPNVVYDRVDLDSRPGPIFPGPVFWPERNNVYLWRVGAQLERYFLGWTSYQLNLNAQGPSTSSGAGLSLSANGSSDAILWA